MNNKFFNKIILFMVIFIVSFIAYKLCYFIAEKYYFDKFFYQKSLTHGYWIDGKNYSDYGNRTKDIIFWELYKKDNPIVPKTEDDSNYYKIAIIGDSYVWGQGLINQDRFVEILSNKLNKIKATKIISIALPNWNNLDYLNAYQRMKKYYSPDLTIFTLVSNDILINKSDSDIPLVKQCQKDNNQLPTYNSTLKEINIAWTNPLNICVLDNSLSSLPTDNTIYFLTEEYDYNWNLTQYYRQHLTKQHKYILSSSIGKNIPKYQRYWNTNMWRNFTISSVEGHPNPLANQMYADLLFNEITTNYL